eukprot:jgi/Tetstr1/456707/TSEL_043407.t1
MPVMASQDASAALTQDQAFELLRKRPADRSTAELASLAQFVRSLPGCLAMLSPEVAQTLCLHLAHRHFAEGEPVLLQGQINSHLYIVVSGHCDLHEQDPGLLRPLLGANSRQPTEDGADAGFGPRLGKQYSFRSQRRASWATEEAPAGAVVPSGVALAAAVADPGNVGERIGIVEAGEPFGEWALLEPGKPASVSVVAGGARGAHCLLLDRPAWRHLAQYAGYGPASAEGPLRALQAALALRPLKWAPEMRSEEDVALLTRVLQGMDSFRGLPEALCSKLAAGMERVRAPHGATIIEEGDDGECMYILLSGGVEVRQQPEPEMLGLEDDDSDNDDDARTAVTAATRLTKKTRTSTMAPGTVKSSRRAKGPHAMSAVEKDAVIAVSDKEADKAGLVEHNGTYWVNQFMESVRKAIPAQEAASGFTEVHMTPLAAIAAAKWRWMTMEERDRARKKKEEEELAKKAAEEEKLREAGAFRTVLGMGAAKAVNQWRQQALAAKKAEEEAMSLMKASHAETTHRAVIEIPKTLDDRLGEDAQSPGGGGGQEAAESPDLNAEPSAVGSAGDNNKAEAGRAAAAAAAARQRWGRAGMAVGFTIKARNLIDPNRRMMDRIARRNPRGLTTHMLSELSRRANVEDVLGMVSKAMMRRGAPRKISVNNSRKLYEAINHTIERGASDRGFGGGGDNRSMRSLRLSQGSAGSAVETMSVASCTSLGDHPDLEDAPADRPPSPTVPAAHHKRTLTRNALLQEEVPLVGVGSDGKPVKRLLGEDPDSYYGPLVRVLTPGSSFGELALLQRNAQRTASVLVPPAPPSAAAPEGGEGEGEFRGVELIRITRECYDQTVNQLMTQQLAELLETLAKVEPFNALPRQHLSSLAVFMRSATFERGGVVVSQGAPAEHLFLITQGEARVLGRYHAGEDLQTLASAPQNPGKLAARAAERVRADNDEDGSMPSAAKMRAMHPSDAAALQGAAGGRRHRAPPAGSVARWGGVGGLNGAGIVVHGGAEVSGLQRMAPLAVVGEGQAFGEELLGLSADAIRVNEDGEECLVPQVYGCTVVATSSPLKVLSISARDLRRFGSKVVAAVQHYARVRARWRSERLGACRAANAAASPAAAAQLTALEEMHGPPGAAAPEAEAPGQTRRLASASLVMARRRSDTDAQRIFDRRGNLPPQLVLALPPPPPASGGARPGGRFPGMPPPSPADRQAAIINRIWSMPAGRPAAPEAEAAPNQPRRLHSLTHQGGRPPLGVISDAQEEDGGAGGEAAGLRLPRLVKPVPTPAPAEAARPLQLSAGSRRSSDNGSSKPSSGKLASGRPVFKLTVSAGPMDLSEVPGGLDNLNIIGLPAVQGANSAF